MAQHVEHRVFDALNALVARQPADIAFHRHHRCALGAEPESYLAAMCAHKGPHYALLDEKHIALGLARAQYSRAFGVCHFFHAGRHALHRAGWQRVDGDYYVALVHCRSLSFVVSFGCGVVWLRRVAAALAARCW